MQFQLGCAASINIWKESVIYDELTINERQKADREFSSMLECVRCGCPTDETLTTLRGRVIQVPVVDKFKELQKSGRTPVCLFSKRKACDSFNTAMLQKLASEVHAIVCTDEIDETVSSRKMTKRAIEHLDKLNSDCNQTAGLEAKLSLAVGARVMLRRNIDTKAGLVNGALGTIIAITAHHVTVQFDHISTPYNVEKVKSRFMVMKNIYVYRKQFPLILAYAVTIHKCQGLSLDLAIVDLSDEIFSEGMAYVALSRLRSLSGLYLSAFDPQSLMVSANCLMEVNRLRQLFRKDLPSFNIPVKSGKTAKRKRTSITAADVPESKKTKQDATIPPAKAKRKRGSSDTAHTSVSPFKFHPVDEQWQRNMCAQTGLQFYAITRIRAGGPNVSLTRPDMRTVKRIQGDGNCLFRAFSYIITGSESQHMSVRQAILDHMISIAHFMDRHIVGYSSIQDYIADKKMDQEFTWGTDIEMLALAHLLQTPVISYSVQHDVWARYAPCHVDRTLVDDLQQMSIYIIHVYNHFNVLCSIRK